MKCPNCKREVANLYADYQDAPYQCSRCRTPMGLVIATSIIVIVSIVLLIVTG